MVSSKRTLSDHVRSYTSAKQAIKRFIAIRWKDGVECPFCKSHHICEFRDGERFKCKICKKIFSFKVGSPLEGSRLSMLKWFKAFEILAIEQDTSSVKLSKELGITQKTAWFMIDRLKGYDISSLREMV
jgi:transposase-like protein